MDVKNQYRKAMTFDGNTEEGVRAIEFLEKSCGRKQGTITTLALIEFIEKYKLEGKSADEIKQFIKNYEYINAVASNSSIGFGIPIPYMNNQTTSQEQKSSVKADDNNKDADSDLRNDLNDIASLFHVQ